MNIYELNDQVVIVNGLIMLASIFAIRFTYLKLFRKENSGAEVFIGPRGLISILLYFNLPPALKIPEVGTSFLFVVVLGSSLIMSVGLLLTKKYVRAEPYSSV
ncbi:hypothetical protein D3C86_920120 [compost metagenome]